MITNKGLVKVKARLYANDAYGSVGQAIETKRNKAEKALKQADAIIMQINILSDYCCHVSDKELQSLILKLKLASCKVQGHLDTRLESFCDPLSEIAADGR